MKKQTKDNKKHLEGLLIPNRAHRRAKPSVLSTQKVEKKETRQSILKALKLNTVLILTLSYLLGMIVGYILTDIFGPATPYKSVYYLHTTSEPTAEDIRGCAADPLCASIIVDAPRPSDLTNDQERGE